MKIAYIMRGIPGSGKSTVASELAGESGVIHSTDDFFYDDGGVYRFDPNLLGRNHARNQAAFRESLSLGISPVVCDNTNSQRWEFEPYVELAKEQGYIVAVVSLSHPDPDVAAARNVHGVSAEVIRRMINRWES